MNWQGNVDLAIQTQLYRRVAVESLSPRGDLPLPPVGSEQADSEALGYANGDNTWLQIGQQLAYSKASDGYLGTYVGRGPAGALHIVMTEAWQGQVTPQFFDTRRAWAWPIFDGVAKLAPHFKLPHEAELRDFVQKAAAQAPQALQPWLGVAGSLANLLLAISESGGGAIGIYMLVDTDGMTPEMAAYGEQWHAKEDPLALHTRTLTSVAVDLQNRKAHGHTPIGSLDLGDFNASLQGAQW